MEESTALKDRANALFSKKQYEAALGVYEEALRAVSKKVAAEKQAEEDKDLRCTLLTNMAACLLQLKRFQECVEECSEALKLDGRRVKALYRRAQAYEELDKLEEALTDLRLSVQMDPTNKAAVASARRVRDALSKQVQSRTPVYQALETLKTTTTVDAKSRASALRTLVGMAAEDVGAAMEIKERGGLPLLWSIVNGNKKNASPSSSETEVLDAIHVLAACCNHSTFVKEAFNPPSSPSPLQEPSLQDLQALTTSEQDSSVAMGGVMVMLRIAKAWGGGKRGAMTTEGGAVMIPPQVSKAVVGAWTQALSHPKSEVRMAGLEAMVTWLSSCQGGHDSAGEGGDITTIKERQRKEEERGMSVVADVLEGEALRRLVSLLDSKEDRGGERQKAALALGRLWGLLVRRGDGDGSLVKASFLDLAPGKGKASAASSFDLPSAERLLLLITALAYADSALALWALQDDDEPPPSPPPPPSSEKKNESPAAAGGGGVRAHIHTLSRLALSPIESAQEIATELINLIMSAEPGRALLGPLVSSEVFIRLMGSPNASVRAAAASAYTKLGLAAKALTTQSQEITRLLNIAADELRRATTTNTTSTASAGKKKQLHSTSTSNDSLSSPPPPSSSTSVDRAVEVLSCLVTRTSLKDEIAFGSGRCIATLPILLSQVKDGRTPSSYGLAFILSSLTLSNDKLREEALAERDITPEQYEQLQKLQKMQTPSKDGGGDGDIDTDEAAEADPPPRVEKRIKEMVSHGAIRALCKLAVGAGAATLEQIATAFAELAVVEASRGAMIQQGGFNTCLDMASDHHDDKTRTKATHAVAKCLVTTNPHLLSERQRMGPIVPLLWLCRLAKATGLQQFESLLALTNLASVGDEVRNAIAAHKGVSAIQYLQYSDHPLVRRAATEAICNMATHPDGIANFRSPDKLKLWLALADDYEGDAATAQAAMGAVATACADQGVCEAMVSEGLDGIKRLESILTSGVVNMVYRAAVAVGYMVGFEKVRDRVLQNSDLLGCLQRLVKQPGQNKTKQQAPPSLPEEVVSAVMYAIDVMEGRGEQPSPPPT